MTSERRRYKRTELITYSRIYDRETGEFLGYVCDMSPSGLMSINDASTETSCERTLKIEVPPLPVITREWMEIPARAVWCQSDEVEPGKYNIGWQFLSTTPEDQEIIHAILENYDLYENQF